MSPVSFAEKIFSHPEKIVTNLGRRGLLNWMSDEAYIKLFYLAVFKKMPDLDNPKTFSEKIQWLKLHDRNPLYTKLVDKYEVKKYVADIIGEEYIIKTLGVWDNFDDIDFETLPNQFVLKCTHDSGGIVICKNKAQLDIAKAKKKINKSLKQNFFYFGREWPYKNVKPRIIAEEYMEDTSTEELRDYKIFTFDGVAKALFIARDRMLEGEDTKFDFYDIQFNHLDFRQGHPNASTPYDKPKSYDLMVKLAEKLAADFPHVRVDFYEVNGKAYFGELTFAHFSGLEPFDPSDWDEKFGSWIKLPIEMGGYCLIDDGIVLWAHQRVKVDVDLRDYKFYCFGGQLSYCQVISNRNTRETIDFFDASWNFQPFTGLTPTAINSAKAPKKPANFAEMKSIVDKLALENPFSRIDLYSINNRTYFGEITLYPYSGMGSFRPNDWDKKIGNLIMI